MDVTLISPSATVTCIGLRGLSSYLRCQGFHTRVLFLPTAWGEGYAPSVLDEVVDLARGSGLVGLSVMTPDFERAVDLTHALRGLQVPMVWGGVHPTVRPEECLAHVDIVCCGEGDETLLELASALASGREVAQISNLCLRRDGRVVCNSLRPLELRLDRLPPPDFGLEDHYILSDGRVVPMSAGLLRRHMGTTYVTVASRGCPYSCTYCVNSTWHALYPDGPPVRRRSWDHLLGELEDVVDRFPFLQAVCLDDDAFLAVSAREIEAFAEKYARRVHLPLIVTGVMPKTLSERKLKTLDAAGLLWARMGIETGSSRTLSMYGRRTTREEILEAAGLLSRWAVPGYPPRYDLILDNPWETEEDLLDTLDLLVHLPEPYRLQAFSLTFYPGTPLHTRAVQEGLIQSEMGEAYRKDFRVLGSNYLNRVIVSMNRSWARVVVRLCLSPYLKRLGVHRLLLRAFSALIFIVRGIEALRRGDVTSIRLRLTSAWAGLWPRIKSRCGVT